MKWSDRVGRRVKLRDLHIALAVADSGSMSKAAEVLAVSYPVVSKTISELERTLGVKLFDRSISGAEPTHYGRALLKCGRAVFDEMRQGLENIEFIKQPDSGDLRIGSSELMDGGLLPAIIEEFSRIFPRVALHVMHSNIALQQYDSLRNRDVELVLGQYPVSFVEHDLIAETLFDDSTLVVTGTESDLAKRRKITLADLLKELWVLTQPGSLPRALQEQIFKMNGVEVPTASVSTLSLQLYTRLVETGHWLGLVPGSVVRFGEKRMRIKVLPIQLRSPPRPVGVITVRNRTLSPLAERFIDCARKVAGVDSSHTRPGPRSATSKSTLARSRQSAEL
jgi:DNA-binding transcriptional LysR family regulator